MIRIAGPYNICF